MTLAELVTALKTLGWPVVYSHSEGAITVPYIAYEEKFKGGLLGDNQVYKKTSTIQVELYTKTKDPTKEASLEALFNSHRLPANGMGEFIDTEKVYQMVYQIGVFKED